MKNKMSVGLSALFAVLFVAVAFLLPAPASAVVGEDCRVVTVENRVGPDSGENGNDWATVTIDRTLKVCATDKPDAGPWQYQATVTDSGEFVTKAGESPGKDLATITAGLKGTVNGGFEAVFTAPQWADDFELTKPDPQTTTGMWIVVAFAGDLDFTAGGSVTNWKWTYNLCGEKGEWWVNAEKSSGDITGKPCPTVSPTTSPTASPTVSPTASPTTSPTTSPTASPTASETVSPTPSESETVDPIPTETTTPPVAGGGGNSGGGLPLTGDKTLFITGLGVLIVAVGGVLFVAAKRRRDEDASTELV